MALATVVIKWTQRYLVCMHENFRTAASTNSSLFIKYSCRRPKALPTLPLPPLFAKKIMAFLRFIVLKLKLTMNCRYCVENRLEDSGYILIWRKLIFLTKVCPIICRLKAAFRYKIDYRRVTKTDCIFKLLKAFDGFNSWSSSITMVYFTESFVITSFVW